MRLNRFMIGIVLCLIILCSFNLVTYGFEFINIKKIADGAYPAIAVDSQENIYTVYAKENSLYFRFFDQQNSSWNDEQNLEIPVGNIKRSKPEILLDSNEQPHVFVGSHYAYKKDDQWHVQETDAFRDTSMALDSLGNVLLIKRGGYQDGYIGLLKKKFNEDAFEILPDPDTTGGNPLGRNNHVYGNMAVSLVDDSIHIVYRHGQPNLCAYRASYDGGHNWIAEGISGDDREAPSIAITDDGEVYVISGSGTVHKRINERSHWRLLGYALNAGRRDLPQIASDKNGNIWVWKFGGQYNVWNGDYWLGIDSLPLQTDTKIGFADFEFNDDQLIAIWEESSGVSNDEEQSENQIFIATANVKDLFNTSQTVAKQWDKFDISINNDVSTSNPYQSPKLSATFEKPDGSKITVPGFYDGNSTWKVRLLPDQLGEWHYELSFDDGTTESNGQFVCKASDIPGKITKLEQNPMWFGFTNNKEVLLRSFHIGDRFFASNWSETKRQKFLDWAQENNYNMLSIASHLLNRDDDTRGRGWNTPDLWPLNASEWQKMEAIIDELAERHIVVFPFAGFFGRKSDFPTDPDEQQQFLEYAMARMGGYWNVLINVGGPEPPLRNAPYMNLEEITEMGRQIQDLNTFDHLVSVHNRTGDDPFRDSDWSDYGVLQGPKTLNQARLSRILLNNHHPEKPLYAQETLWGGNIHGHPDYGLINLRKNAYIINMSAATLNFGDMNGNSSSGFSGKLELSDRHPEWHEVVKHVWDFFETVPFHKMQPRQNLVSKGYCLAEPGQRYLVYLERPDIVSVKIKDGPYRYNWINAQNRFDVHEEKRTEHGKNLISPQYGEDWLLYLYH